MTTNPNWPSIAVQVQFSGSTWTDIAGRVQKIDAKRGRQYELTRAQAGSLTLTVDNSDGALDPTNTASPYYPNVILYRPIRVQATWAGVTSTLWSGFVERWPQEWGEAGNHQMTTVVAVDILAALAQKKFDEHLTGELINQLGPTYWWPLERSTAAYQTPERVGGVWNGRVLTYGGNQQVQVGSGNGLTGSPGAGGLEGASIAVFTPQMVGSNVATNASIIRLYSTVNGQALAFPATPWTLTLTLQTNQRSTSNGPAVFLAFEDSGAGNQYLRFAVDPYGFLFIWARDSNGSSYSTSWGVQLGDGSPHVLSIELSGTNPVLYFSVDGGGYGTVSSGNPSGWQFTNLVDLNLGAQWPRNSAADAALFYAYGGLLGHVAWFGGHNYVTAGTFSGATSYPARAVKGLGGDDTSARIANIMSVAGRGSSFTSLGTGDATLESAVIGGKDAAGAILETNDWENGTLFVRGDGQIVFAPRRSRYKPVSAYTLGAGTSYPLTVLALDYDTTKLANVVSVDRRGGINTITTNSASVSTYGTWTKQVSSTGLADDNQSYALGQYLAGRYSAPATRISKAALDPAGNPSLWPLIAGSSSLEINSCVTVQHSPLAGHAVTLQCWVESINYQISPDQFVVSMDLSPTDARTWLTLDDATNGHLDTPPILLSF
ncbi:hypothetical protein [Nocardia sp. NPDC046763]|uniref:hypothetical protein n=1 Tax=Nocardia sp. NPDC046763 TaxID=3155256 RepID=UPI0033D5AD52